MDQAIARTLKKFIPLSAKRAWNGRNKLKPIWYWRDCGPRISIKSPVPSDTIPEQWGDYHFANSLAHALYSLGCCVRIDFLDSWDQGYCGDSAVVVLRGFHRYRPKEYDTNILWNISHPIRVSNEEMREYDHVYTAGSRAGCNLLYQCSDPRYFHTNHDGPYLRRPIFAGNARGQTRKIVKDCIDAGIDIDVYGRGWEGRIPHEMIAGKYIPNDKLGSYYAAAPVVLNDQWDDMDRYGYISNRIFDAYACGALICTTPIRAVISDIFPGDRVLEYHSLGELKKICAMRKKKRTVPSPHTFEARAQEILRILGFDVS